MMPNGCTSSQTRTWIYKDNCDLQSKPFQQAVTWPTDNITPTITFYPPAQSLCTVLGNTYTIPVITATDNCPTPLVYSYSITGATPAEGISDDASGVFFPGLSVINWTVTDGCGKISTQTTNVTIAPAPTAIVSGPSGACSGTTVTISIALTGTGPWSVTYTDGGSPVTVNNILTSPYTFTPPVLLTSTTYSLTAVSDTRVLPRNLFRQRIYNGNTGAYSSYQRFYHYM